MKNISMLTLILLTTFLNPALASSTRIWKGQEHH